MAVEDFSTFTELDDNSRIAVTSSRVSWAELTIGEDAHVYKDKGVNSFSGNFTHLLTVKMTGGANDGEAYCWALTNLENTMRAIDVANGDYLSVYLYYYSPNASITIEECDGGTLHSDSYIINFATPYYLKIVRDESVGTYGTLYCYIYSDSARTTLLHTLTETLNSSKKDYRYLYALNTLGAGTTQNTSGYCENLEFTEGSSSGGTPTVTTQANTNVIAENATGNGYIISVGTSAVTQHGHCWNTSTNPTTSNSKTSLGAIGQSSHFTSSITGLTPGTGYYVRAYATNTTGTAYGGNETIAGNVTTIGRRHLWIEGADLHYFDEYGIERKIEGLAVTSGFPWWHFFR